jgi:hypothetical protein
MDDNALNELSHIVDPVPTKEYSLFCFKDIGHEIDCPFPHIKIVILEAKWD